MESIRAQDSSVGELVAFVVLCRTGSFTASARALHLTQPGLSARIARLERTLGARLVDRSARPSRPTAAGQAFLPHAEAAVEAVLRGGRAVTGCGEGAARRATPPRPAATSIGAGDGSGGPGPVGGVLGRTRTPTPQEAP